MKFKYNFFLFSFLSITFLTISSYPQQMKSKIKTKMMKEQITKAVCVIHPTKGHKAHGLIIFSKVENGIKVVANIQGLKPGKHGFHIHEYGDCDIGNPNEPFSFVGGHFNPTKQPHGNHAGDFPVLFSNNGISKMIFFTNKFDLDDIIGKSVVIHQNPDDYRTDPSGNSGKRLGCGIISMYGF